MAYQYEQKKDLKNIVLHLCPSKTFFESKMLMKDSKGNQKMIYLLEVFSP